MNEKIFRSEKEKPWQPLEIIPYATQYPDDILKELQKPYEERSYVNQGHGEISLDGSPLWSEGFSFCAAMLLQNTRSPEAALLHIDGIDLNYEHQVPLLRKLSSEEKYDVFFIRGTLSRDLKSRILESDGFTKVVKPERIYQDICFETGKQHWGLFYKPKERMLYLDSRKNKQLLCYKI